MGFVTLTNGETVHTSALNPNPVVEIKILRSWRKGNVEFTEFDYIHKNGKSMKVTQSVTI